MAKISCYIDQTLFLLSEVCLHWISELRITDARAGRYGKKIQIYFFPNVWLILSFYGF